MSRALKEDNIRVTMELRDLNQQVVSVLGAGYESSKGVFPVQRYEMLKTMIKAAIQASRPDKLEKVQNIPHNLTTLEITGETKKRQKNMSKEDIEADTAAKRREIETIRGLEKDYDESKGLFPVRRSFVMNRMVRRRIPQRTETLTETDQWNTEQLELSGN